MINKDRIVPVTKSDLLTVYATILQIMASGTPATFLNADNAEGDFTITADTSGLSGGLAIASEPVKSLLFALPLSPSSNIVFMFIPAVDFDGFTAWADAEGGSVMNLPYLGEVVADGATLHTFTYRGGQALITPLGTPITSDDSGEGGGEGE